MKIEIEISDDELRELVQADRDGRCVVLPRTVWKIGETKEIIEVKYLSWMGRFMGYKFFNRREAAEAALKGEHNG